MNAGPEFDALVAEKRMDDEFVKEAHRRYAIEGGTMSLGLFIATLAFNAGREAKRKEDEQEINQLRDKVTYWHEKYVTETGDRTV